MLVFTLQVESEFIIETAEGRVIEGKVLKIDRGVIRIGFTADQSTIIDRKEVAEQKRAVREAKGVTP